MCGNCMSVGNVIIRRLDFAGCVERLLHGTCLVLALSWDFSWTVHWRPTCSLFMRLGHLTAQLLGSCWECPKSKYFKKSKDTASFSNDLTSACHCYRILFFKQVTVISPDSSCRDVDSSSSHGKQHVQLEEKKLNVAVSRTYLPWRLQFNLCF